MGKIGLGGWCALAGRHAHFTIKWRAFPLQIRLAVPIAVQNDAPFRNKAVWHIHRCAKDVPLPANRYGMHIAEQMAHLSTVNPFGLRTRLRARGWEQVITASSDGTVRVWDAKTCDCLNAFRPPVIGTGRGGDVPVTNVHLNPLNVDQLIVCNRSSAVFIMTMQVVPLPLSPESPPPRPCGGSPHRSRSSSSHPHRPWVSSKFASLGSMDARQSLDHSRLVPNRFPFFLSCPPHMPACPSSFASVGALKAGKVITI